MTYDEAYKAVAQDWRKLAYAIRKEDKYASHVTEERKEQNLQDMLMRADEIERGEIKSFTIAQRVYEKMYNVNIPLLSAGAT